MFNSFPGWALILMYVVLAVALCLLSKKLADYVDALDKKTKISGAFIGGVLLAAVTSLPELFTSISATILLPDSASLVVGNILGSNLFNIAILGLCFILFFKKFIDGTFEFKSHFTVIIGTYFIYAVVSYGLLVNESLQPIVGPINFLALLILLIYAGTIFLQPKESEDEEEKEDNYDLTIKQIVIRFIICAVLLVAVSIFITYDTDALSAQYGIDKTTAGAIFLAIATSLPELVSSLALCKKGNWNAAVGDIVGSCLFNFCIIGLAEFMSFRVSILPGFTTMEALDFQSFKMIYLALIVLFILSLCLFIKSRLPQEKQNTIGFKIYLIVTGVLLIAGYAIFLII